MKLGKRVDVATRGDDRAPDGRFAGYEPTRPSKLRQVGEPPPLPPPAERHVDGFGTADEDGLRMLAALETLTSLEPDYSDDLTAEASVTIIESFGDDAVAEALTADPNRPLRALLEEDRGPELLLNGYETFVGTGDEATVEIVEIGEPFAEDESATEGPATQPASLAERIAALAGRNAPGGRFFKALSGG